MLIVEPPDLEIGSAAVRYRTGVAKYLPQSFRTLDGGGRARASNGFTRRNATINEIEGQCHERSDFNHRSHLAAYPGAIRISSVFSRARDMDRKFMEHQTTTRMRQSESLSAKNRPRFAADQFAFEDCFHDDGSGQQGKFRVPG
jgi:hypothetical protein